MICIVLRVLLWQSCSGTWLRPPHTSLRCCRVTRVFAVENPRVLARALSSVGLRLTPLSLGPMVVSQPCWVIMGGRAPVVSWEWARAGTRGALERRLLFLRPRVPDSWRALILHHPHELPGGVKKRPRTHTYIHVGVLMSLLHIPPVCMLQLSFVYIYIFIYSGH